MGVEIIIAVVALLSLSYVLGWLFWGRKLSEVKHGPVKMTPTGETPILLHSYRELPMEMLMEEDSTIYTLRTTALRTAVLSELIQKADKDHRVKWQLVSRGGRQYLSAQMWVMPTTLDDVSFWRRYFNGDQEETRNTEGGSSTTD